MLRVPARRFSSQTPTNFPVRVGIVGSGPAGFYTTESLLTDFAKLHPVQVDIFEKLPVPFGLVRYGVAPDHPEVKLVQNRFSELASDPRVRFFGNVEVGKTIGVNDLRKHYHAVVFSYGSEDEKLLNIPGEDLRRVHSAREFVGWYNGHPHFAYRDFELESTETAAIIGTGNVALDVARILLRPPHTLEPTDVMPYALEKFKRSTIREVHLIGRRGFVQSAWTSKELREILSLPRCRVVMDESFLQLNPESEEELKKDRAKTRQFELLKKVLKEHKEAKLVEPGSRTLVLHFLRSPIRFLSSDGMNVSGVELQVNRLEGPAGNQKAVSTGKTETLPCDIVFKSIGYKAQPLPPLPFDTRRHIIPNVGGRVLENADTPDKFMTGVYVSGWVKRGPSGIIGTNKFDAQETVMKITEDWKEGKLKQEPLAGADGLREYLTDAVSFEEWKRIEQKEYCDGKATGKVRLKVFDIKELLQLAKANTPA